VGDDGIRAAGAVLWRPADGGVEFCLVHRPKYDDWSLPKGKLNPGEHPVVAAVREVLEETGVRAHPLLRLPDVAYTLPSGEPKTVEFWAMRAGAGPAVAVADPAEVDDIRWLALEAAEDALTYPADARLAERVAALPPITAVTPMVRHAHAGERKKWVGNDALRPIDAQGQREAETLVEPLMLFQPTRLIAAPPLRCRQTLEPLAESLGMPIVSDSAFGEPPTPDEIPDRVKAAATRLAELRDGPAVAICSQGKLMPPLLATLTGADGPEPYKTPKGGGWILSWSGARLVGVSRL
jgi:8-oxo-dGTP pyrophosphatase MutT (NUDIX family)/phosphohistidine phosphatase SixA